MGGGSTVDSFMGALLGVPPRCLSAGAMTSPELGLGIGPSSCYARVPTSGFPSRRPWQMDQIRLDEVFCFRLSSRFVRFVRSRLAYALVPSISLWLRFFRASDLRPETTATKECPRAPRATIRSAWPSGGRREP